MADLIEAHDIEVSFSVDAPPAVTGVNLSIPETAAIGIVGESGSGKTTLGRVLVGALDPTGGMIVIDGRPWSSIKRRDSLRRSIQMIFQDAYGSLNPWLTARQTVAEVVRVWEPVNRREANKRAEDLLCEVGFPHDAMGRRASQLSGGQCQRVGIARALACNPRILIADEPTSSLDVSVQAQILNLLATLRENRDLGLVLISHDLGVVRYATDESLVMYAGHVVERGPTEALFSHPLHPYTRVLVDSIPGQEGPARPADNQLSEATGCVFAGRCAHFTPDCLVEQPALAEHAGRLVACTLSAVCDSRSSEVLDRQACAQERA